MLINRQVMFYICVKIYRQYVLDASRKLIIHCLMKWNFDNSKLINHQTFVGGRQRWRRIQIAHIDELTKYLQNLWRWWKWKFQIMWHSQVKDGSIMYMRWDRMEILKITSNTHERVNSHVLNVFLHTKITSKSDLSWKWNLSKMWTRVVTARPTSSCCVDSTRLSSLARLSFSHVGVKF